MGFSCFLCASASGTAVANVTAMPVSIKCLRFMDHHSSRPEYTRVQSASCSCSDLHHARCIDRKSTRLNSSHLGISYAVFCLKKKKQRPVSALFILAYVFLCSPPDHPSYS